MTDAQILIGISQNDNKVWSYICQTMRGGFSAILTRTFNFGNSAHEELEDIFQESCIILMQKVREGKVTVSREGAIFSYLVQIGKFCASNHIRKKRPLTPVEEAAMTLRLLYDESDPEMTVNEKQKNQDDFLDRVFDSLPDICKNILKQFYWNHMSMEDIASTIGFRNADSVKTRKNKCMNNFKDIAAKLIESDEFAEEAVRAAVERAALKDIIRRENEYAKAGVKSAAYDIDTDEDNN